MELMLLRVTVAAVPSELSTTAPVLISLNLQCALRELISRVTTASARSRICALRYLLSMAGTVWVPTLPRVLLTQSFWGGNCIRKSPPSCAPSCEPGQTLTGDNFMSERRPECPKGLTLVGGYCKFPDIPVCEPGTNRHENDYTSSVTPECSTGSFFNGVNCASTKRPVCKPGFIFNGSTCVSEKDVPNCLQGMYFDGTNCVSTIRPECESAI
jgi:hypothetical protein